MSNPRQEPVFNTVLSISSIKIGKRCRKDMGDIDALARSMSEIGLLQPMVAPPITRSSPANAASQERRTS